MRYLSLCSGIEAASVAWEPLGWQAAAFSDIEPFPSAVIAHHWPEVPNLGDMTKYEKWPDVGTIDILAGGTPCQAFSVAGKRGGLDDARGNLALTYCDIADKYDPEWCLWENVPGVLTDKGNAFGCFLGRLCGASVAATPESGKWSACGMVSGPRRTIAWRVLDAQYFGVAQRRRRVFVLAVRGPGNWRGAAALFPVGDGVQWHPSKGGEKGKDLAPTLAARTRGGGGLGTDADLGGAVIAMQAGMARINPDSGPGGKGFQEGLAYTLEARPEVQMIANCLTAREGKGVDSDVTTTLIAFPERMSGTQCARAQDIAPTIQSSDPTAIAFDTTHLSSARNGSNPQPGDPCHTLAAGAHAPAVVFSARDRGDDGRGYDRPPQVFGDVAGALDTVKTHLVATLAIRGRDGASNLEIGTDGVANTILTPSGGRAGIGVGAIHYASTVRRLTPRECERLQGFPDDHTAIPWRGKHADQCPDGPRYRAVGNSMAVPVMRWIGKRIEFVNANY